MATEITQEEFISKCVKQHGKTYDYSNVRYNHKNDKINVICPLHGEFSIIAYNHLKGQGCPECDKIMAQNPLKGDFSNFLDNAYQKFGKKYSFPNIENEFLNNKSRITVKCENCGRIFHKRVVDFLHSTHGGCFCTKKSMISYDELKDSCINYKIVKFDGKLSIKESHVTLICPNHGKFKVKISSLLRNRYDCPYCDKMGTIKSQSGAEICAEICKISKNQVIPNVNTFIDIDTKMQFKCSVCGNVFERKPSTYFTTKLRKMCPFCNKNHVLEVDKVQNNLNKSWVKRHKSSTSQQEDEIADFITSLGVKIIRNDRQLLDGQEIDIYMPEYNVAIEVDGLYWHSEVRKDAYYHLNKTKRCTALGVKLIHIYEDEWINKKDVIKSMINHILFGFENKISARKCVIKEVENKIAYNFLDKNNLFGKCCGCTNIGLFYDDQIVFLMSIKQLKGTNTYEIIRMCSKIFTRVNGGVSKVLDYIIQNYNADKIVTKVDLRVSNGDTLHDLGFKRTMIETPDFYYVVNGERHKKTKFSKRNLVMKYECPMEMTEHDFCLSKKWFRIYDCGKWVFELII